MGVLKSSVIAGLRIGKVGFHVLVSRNAGPIGQDLLTLALFLHLFWQE